jgi:hypothetical protein
MFYPGARRRPGARWIRRLSLTLLAMLPVVGSARGPMLPPEIMARVANPWPPAGWSDLLDLPERSSMEPHRSEPRLGSGYFGQSLYRAAGAGQYWTANVLIQDRGSASAAWRAVSAVSCRSRNYHGYRARECERPLPGAVTRTLHYEVGRFHVTIQVTGPGSGEYPWFELRGAEDARADIGPFGGFW